MNRSYRCFWITNSPQTSRNKVNMGYFSPSWPYLYLYIPPSAKAGGPDPAIWFADKDDLDFPSVQRPEFSRPPIIAGLCWVHRPDLIFFYQTVRQAQFDCGQSTAIDQIKNSIVVGPASREFSKWPFYLLYIPPSLWVWNLACDRLGFLRLAIEE